MRSRLWLRIAAVCLFIICLGHSVGHFFPQSRGFGEEALFKAMRAYSFDVMGFERTHWHFYRGLSLLFSVNILVLGIVTWILSSMGERLRKERRALTLVLFVGSFLVTILCWTNFFAAPAVFSTAATLAYALSLRDPKAS